MTEGKSASVFDDPPGTGAQVIQSTEFFAACRAATVSAACRKVGWIGDDQIKSARGKGCCAKITVQHITDNLVVLQVAASGFGRQKVNLHSGQREALLTPFE